MMEEARSVDTGIEFTKKQIDDWWAYETIRKSGVINMLDVRQGCELSDLNRDEYMFSLRNYSALKRVAQAEQGRG